jgi:predicted  nucleic acid-binding Zn-ribbon protein
MQADLKQVSGLQALDRRIGELRKEIAELPKQMAVIERQLEAHIRQLDAAKATLAAHQKERKQKELDIQTHQQKAAKLKDQMSQAKNNEQYRAFQHEIDFAQAEIAKAEDRILALLEESEPLERNVKKAEAALAEEKKSVEAQKADARKRTGEDQKELDQRIAERAELVKAIPPKIASAYERIRKRYPMGPALSEMTDGRCTACQITLRQQVIQELKQGGDIFFCESCGRILFHNPPVSLVSMS